MRRLASMVTCLGLLAALVACGDGVTGGDHVTDQQEPEILVAGGREPDGPPNPTADRTGPLPDGGASSCVEAYAPEALVGRAFAFDGVVLEVGPPVSDRGDEGDLGLPGVTFEVRQWFAGGESGTVTVDLQPADTDTSVRGTAYGIGSRLLVSGEARWGGSALEHPIAWGCGFSRYYDPETAAAWHEALR